MVTKAVEAEAGVGNFLFRSKFSDWLWSTSTGSPFYIVRLVGAVLISLILVARAGKLFVYTRLTARPVLGFLVVGCVWGGPVKTLAAGLIVACMYLFYQQWRQPTTNAGHRAGGKGFTGELPENTLEALRHLIREDRKRAIPDLHYVEFDVHETADGELAVLHDLGSLLAASQEAASNTAPLQAIRSSGVDLKGATVRDLTWGQLKSLHIGGKEGVHTPTLEAFLRCCEEEKLEHSIAVEVKSISTDRGRQKFLDILRGYLQRRGSVLDKKCPGKKYEPFGWLSAISFPFSWAASFGEFCTPEWKLWADRFNEAGVPVRSCVLHSLDLVPPVR